MTCAYPNCPTPEVTTTQVEHTPAQPSEPWASTGAGLVWIMLAVALWLMVVGAICLAARHVTRRAPVQR